MSYSLGDESPLPRGLRVSVESGLILPDELSRERQVWTKGEWRLLSRATEMLSAHGIDLLLQCKNERCRKQPLAPSWLPDGSFQLRCEHADRIMTKAF